MRFLKSFLTLLLLMVSIRELKTEEFNPWNLSIQKRVIHRKNVSHILMDPRVDHYRVVILMGDRFPYSYKSTQYGFYIKAETAEEALRILNAFDKQLETGHEIFLKLNGSRIVEWSFSS